MSTSHDAVAALRSWMETCAPHMRPQLARLLQETSGLADLDLIARISARAAKHGHRAVQTAWTDVADPDRLAGKVFSAIGSCDTTLLSNPAGAFIEMEPTLESAKIAAQMPLAHIMLYDGQSLQDYLLDVIKVTRIPRMATVKFKACLVYSDAAEVKLRTRSYHGVKMTTYAFTPSGQWTDVGIREGGGLLAMGHRDGQMKAFAFKPGVASDMITVGTEFGPRGADIDTARNDVIMTVTLYRKGPPRGLGAVPYFPGAPQYRGLCAAEVTCSETNIGAAVAEPDMAEQDIDGVVVEVFFCKVVDHPGSMDGDTDAMCREILRAQAGAGSDHPTVTATLDALEGKSFCPSGHGPYEHRTECPECKALCVCL
jgi:hypothetical protein